MPSLTNSFAVTDLWFQWIEKVLHRYFMDSICQEVSKKKTQKTLTFKHLSIRGYWIFKTLKYLKKYWELPQFQK